MRKILFLIIVLFIATFLCLYSSHALYVCSQVGFDSLTNRLVLKSIFNEPFIIYNQTLINSNDNVFIGFALNIIILVITLAIILIYVAFPTNKNYKYKNIEHGSAKFSTKSEMKAIRDKDLVNNRILSKNALLSLDGRKIRRNSNIAVFGGSGAGKTYGFLKPNLMQMNSSYIITDPKGEILRETGKMLEDNGYKIKVLNINKLSESDNYNPFAYINMEEEQEIITLINFLMENTNDGQKSKDPFWDGAEKMLITAMVFYIMYEGGENEKNIDTMMYLINKINLNKEEGEIDVIDILFSDFAEKYGYDHIAVRNYNSFRNGGAKNQGSILLTNSARLNIFNLDVLKKLTSIDTIDLKSIGDKDKVALFILTSPADRSLNFLAGLLYTQLFKILDTKANQQYGGALPYPVAFFLDEFANIGKIPNFPEILAYARSLNISIVPILQSLSQLKKMYEKEWESIIDNCDTTIFLGGQGAETTKYFSEKLGNATIDMLANNKSFGQQKSISVNESKLARKLLTPEELASIDVNKCIVFVKSLNPFMDYKYNPKKHKNFKLTGDYDKCNQYKFVRKENDFDFDYGEISQNKSEIDDINNLVEQQIDNSFDITYKSNNEENLMVSNLEDDIDSLGIDNVGNFTEIEDNDEFLQENYDDSVEKIYTEYAK